MRSSTFVAMFVLAVGLLATAPAAAQEAEEGVEVQVETPDVPSPELAPPPPPPPPPPPVVDETPRGFFEPRLRLGGSLVGGGSWEGPDIGMFGAQVRAGVQLGDWIALYYQPTGMVGFLVDRPDTEPEGDLAGVLWNSLLVEVTVEHFLQFGVGPSVDFVWGCSPGNAEEQGCAEEDANFGLHGRVAVAIGGIFGGGPYERRGVSISLDVHPTWYGGGDEGIAMLGGIGFDMY